MTLTDPNPVGFSALPAGLPSVTKLMQLAGSELSQNGIGVVVHRFGNDVLLQESQSQTKSEVGSRKILWICVCQEGLLLKTNAGPVFMQLRLCLNALNDSMPRFPPLLTPWRLRPFLVSWYRPQTPGIFQQHGVSWCQSSLSKSFDVLDPCVKT